jgi:hypothetical protein
LIRLSRDSRRDLICNMVGEIVNNQEGLKMKVLKAVTPRAIYLLSTPSIKICR